MKQNKENNKNEEMELKEKIQTKKRKIKIGGNDNNRRIGKSK